jgi:hypothetical protein
MAEIGLDFQGGGAFRWWLFDGEFVVSLWWMV